MTLTEKVRTHREEILNLASRRGATNIRVFGSIARGEATEESNVDFLVRMDDERSYLDLVGLSLDLQDLLGCKVDVVEEEGLRPGSREVILREAVSL